MSQYRSTCSPLFCSCFEKIRSSRQQMFLKIGVLKNFAIFRGKHLCWSLFLLKLHACNFPVNITKFFKNSFFCKTSPVATSEKFRNFPVKYQWRRRNRFIFLINTTDKYEQFSRIGLKPVAFLVLVLNNFHQVLFVFIQYYQYNFLD